MQDGISAGCDPFGRFLGRQLMDMHEMSLNRAAVALEDVAILEGVEGIARAVPIDDGETDGPNDMRTVIEKHRCDWRRNRASAGLVMILS